MYHTMESNEKSQEQNIIAENKKHIDEYMSAVEDLIKVQTEAKCRRNVWETISLLKERYPHLVEYINNKLNALCEKHHVDFFEDIKTSI